MIVKQMLVGDMAVFCYIIGCEKTSVAMVVDPAGDEETIVDEAKAAGLDIKFIFNSHGHADHTCGNARMKELTGAQIVMHEVDDSLFNGAEGAEMSRSWGFRPSPPADITLSDEEYFMVGEQKINIIHTPGHSPGGLCLLAENQVFTGDTIFVGSGGRTDIQGANLNHLLESIKKLISLPEETIVWPGHDYGPTPSSTIAKERTWNMYVLEFGLLDD